MKIRWTAGSMRLRITPGELEALGRGETAREVLQVAGGTWGAALVPGGASSEVVMSGGTVEVRLAASDVATLLEPDREGVYFSTDGPPPLRFFVEKDFPCIHPRAIDAHEPTTETFTPPEGFAERKA